jgi:hypothetical protein
MASGEATSPDVHTPATHVPDSRPTRQDNTDRARCQSARQVDSAPSLIKTPAHSDTRLPE